MSNETAKAMLQPVAPVPTAEVPTAEVPTAEVASGTPPEPETKELESTRFAHLAKKEQELVKRHEQFKKEQSEYQANVEKLKSVQKQISDFEALRQHDPVAALKQLGFNEQDLYNFMNNQATPEERARMVAQREIEQFKTEQQRKEQEIADKRNSEAIGRFKKDIVKTIDSNVDKFELCKHYGQAAQDLIYETVNATFKDTGEVLSALEAAEMVEKYYEDQIKAAQSLKKFKPKEITPEPKEEVEVKKEEPLRAQVSPMPSKTLTSKTSATVASTTTKKAETQSEKRERLMKKLASFGKE